MTKMAKLQVNCSYLIFWTLLSLILEVTPQGVDTERGSSEPSNFGNLERRISQEMENSKEDLIRDTILLRTKAEVFVITKLKQNLFRKLRAIVDGEPNFRKYKVRGFATNPKFNSAPFRRHPRQNEEEEDAEDEETSSSGNSSTTARPSNIIPQVANLVKAIFGGNSINITSYAQAATKFLPPSIGNQVLGVVKLLAHNPSARWTTTTSTTPPPTEVTTSALRLILIKQQNETISKRRIQPGKYVLKNKPTNGTVPDPDPAVNPTIIIVQSPAAQPPAIKVTSTTSPARPIVIVTSKPTKAPIDEEEEDEDSEDNSRQLYIPELSQGINSITSLFGGRATRAPGSANATTESASGFEEESTSSGNIIDLRELASGLRLGLGDLIKVMPDLFKGAREAVGLLSGIQGLLGSFGG